MAELPRNLGYDDLKNILKQAFLSEPLGRAGIEDYIKAGGEVSPYQAMLGRSSLIDYARQVLPDKLANTNWYANLESKLPDADLKTVSGVRRRLANQIGEIPLGGYGAAEKKKLSDLRMDNLRAQNKYIDASKVPLTTGQYADIGDSFSARAAQTAGVVGRDIATDGLRNIWWFLNAPQAVAQIAALQGIHQAGKPYTVQNRPLVGRGALRLAATAPAVIAMSTGIGNIGRPAGYKAILPSDEDPRKTDSPVGELLSRYFLGRTGRLLPYDEFAKERPDVDKGEYQRYKAYQFNKQTDLNPLDGDFNILGALRGTTEGIHGPEINFMGKAIPALTGILPTAAAVMGIRKGIRKAGKRLQERGDLDMVKKLEKDYDQAKAMPKDNDDRERLIDELGTDLDKLRDENSIEAAKQALLYGSGYTTAAALTGQALESIRRDMGRED
tara:strand:+ start:117 stop:1442 length:1326 start_codon:yes stop_codon:yes gene_type:complete